MQPDVNKWLTKEESEKLVGLLGYASVHSAMDASIVVELAESLAVTRKHSERRRVLMEKHEWDAWFYFGHHCVECHQSDTSGHKPDCAWDAALKGGGGEELKTGGANEKE